MVPGLLVFRFVRRPSCAASRTWPACRLPPHAPVDERAVRTDPNSGLAHDYLGVAYFKQGQHAAALHQFQEEARLDPDPSTAWARIADGSITDEPSLVAALGARGTHLLERWRRASTTTNRCKPISRATRITRCGLAGSWMSATSICPPSCSERDGTRRSCCVRSAAPGC